LELATRVDEFSAIRQDRVLGLIQSVGLSRNRESALIKMDFRLRLLSNEEALARQQEALVRELLDKIATRDASYVLAGKSALDESRSPILNKEVLDSLIKNDVYGFLVKKTIDAGQRTREIASQRSELEERRKRMETFSRQDYKVRDDLVGEVDKALSALRKDYDQLVALVRDTDADFVRSSLTDAVRVSFGPSTGSSTRSGLIIIGGWGACGVLLGLGLSMVGFNDRKS
jgi:hypothetical protein